MKKTLSLLSSILFFNFSLISQNIKITEGPEYKTVGSRFSYYIDKDENSVYCMRYKQKATSVACFIQKIDLKTLLPIYCVEINESFETLYLVKDKILAFSTTYDKKEQIKYFWLSSNINSVIFY